MRKSLIVDICGFIFILVFAYAAISKLIDYHNFYRQINLSPLLNKFSGIISILIPLIELGIVTMLLTERLKLFGLYASFSLMVLFTGYIFYILHYSEDIPCSCGGILQHMGWSTHFVFNISLILFSIVAIFLDSRSEGSHETIGQQ